MTRLIHVCGAARTGTTSVGLALGQAPEAFYGGEVHAYYRPFRPHHWNPECSCLEHPCPVWEKLGGGKASGFVQEAAESLGVDYIIDSSGDLPWLLDHHSGAADGVTRS